MTLHIDEWRELRRAQFWKGFILGMIFGGAIGAVVVALSA